MLNTKSIGRSNMQTPGTAAKPVEWIVVANEARALIYRRLGKHGPLEKVLAFHNDAAHGREASLQSDREGRSFDSHGQGRHAMTREKSGPKRHAAEEFAREIAARLEKGVHDGHCAGFALIAAPRFLGMLRKELDGPGLPEPFLSVDKDVVEGGEEAIRKLLG
jgi:protein required for attachment to host cells